MNSVKQNISHFKGVLHKKILTKFETNTWNQSAIPHRPTTEPADDGTMTTVMSQQWPIATGKDREQHLTSIFDNQKLHMVSLPSYADPEAGGGGGGGRGPDYRPLKITPSSVRQKSCHHRSAIEITFPWWADGGLLRIFCMDPLYPL